jgi:PAS domain S-box-containing protein
MLVQKVMSVSAPGQALRGTELLDHIELPILVVNHDLTLSAFNPTAAKLFSLTPSEYGKRLDSIAALAGIGSLRELCEQVIAGGSPRQAEVRGDHGAWFSLSIGSFKTNRNTDGAIVTLTDVTAFRERPLRPARERDHSKAVLNIVADAGITERKREEHSQRHLAAIVESSDDAIVSKDLNGIVTSWNPAAERIFHYSAKEMIGKSITVIIPAELQDDERRILETIGRGERIDHFETERLTKDGERLNVSLTISPVRDESGRVIGAAKIARDITREKKTEQTLRTTEKLASVGRMAATVAHEINNPLEAITNLVYLAKVSTGKADVREFLDTIDEELGRISHITKQTLGFYRESAAPGAMTVGPMLDQLISFFKGRARHKRIEIRAQIRRDPVIYGVLGEIRQLIANLLSNSFDAVGSSGIIRIRVDAARLPGHHAPGMRITIADSGEGISPSIRSKLFDPFFTTKKDVGTGLGLWVSANIVKKHNGSIRVKSSTAPGRSGTTFSVLLPSGKAEESLKQSSLPSQAAD